MENKKEEPDVLYCIICGPEQSGTTMLGELINQHPKLEGHFEVGFYMDEHILDFKSRPNLVEHIKSWWKVDDADMHYILSASSHREAFCRLHEKSGVKKEFIYDKFPGYIRSLNSILKMAQKPCVANVRDPRAIVASRKKRRPELNLRSACNQINACYKGLDKALCHHDIHLVRHEKLCLNKSEEAKKIFDYLKLDFSEDYLKLEGHAGNIKTGGISVDSLFTYKETLTQEEQDYILQATDKYKEYHWLED